MESQSQMQIEKNSSRVRSISVSSLRGTDRRRYMFFLFHFLPAHAGTSSRTGYNFLSLPAGFFRASLSASFWRRGVPNRHPGPTLTWLPSSTCLMLPTWTRVCPPPYPFRTWFIPERDPPLLMRWHLGGDSARKAAFLSTGKFGGCVESPGGPGPGRGRVSIVRRTLPPRRAG